MIDRKNSHLVNPDNVIIEYCTCRPKTYKENRHEILSILNPVIFLFLVCIFFFGGCTSVKVSDYASMQPIMTPENFFNGVMTAHGVIKNRSGQVTSYFNADIIGSWKDGVGILEEDFVFSDGEKSRRVWSFRKNKDGTYTATAADVVGEALGEVSGNAMFLKYVTFL